MGLFDKLFKKSVQGIGSAFGSAMGMSAPDIYAGRRAEAYRGWVFACVNAIAEDIASTELRLEELGKDGKWELAKDQEPVRILHAANPAMSGYDLLFATAAYLLIDGNFFLFVAYNGLGKPAELWPLDPTKVNITIKNGIVQNYRTMTSNGNKELLPNEIVPFKRFNPKDIYRGIGTVEAARLAIDTDENAASWNNNYFYNSAEPSASLETAQALNAEQIGQIRAKWEEVHSGANNAHKLAILHSGLSYKPTQLSHNDMQFLEQRRYSRDEIMAMFRVPKTVLGIVEDVNRANAEASDYVFAKRVIKPLLGLIADKLNEFYLPLWKLDPMKYRITFKDPVPQNEELTLRKNDTGLKNGYYTINEVRATEGLQPVDGGDVAYIPLNMVPLSYGQSANITDPNAAKGILRKSIEKTQGRRVRFVTNEVQKWAPKYKELILSRKGQIIRQLKDSKKSLSSKKKDVATDMVNILFMNIADTWLTEIEDTNKDLYRRVIAEAGIQALVQVGIDQTFDLKNPRAVDWMALHALENATSVIDTIKREVKVRLVAGLDEGLSTFQIADSIGEFFDAEVDYRAQRIARTEVVGSYAEGSLEGYRQSGVVRMKAWMTVGDDRVEDECQMNEDQGPIALDASFASGQSAPPVHPNCRCTLIPVVDEGKGIDRNFLLKLVASTKRGNV